ncbi:MAG TPA: hypothetical protein VNG35_08570, partial [Gemmatimonadales bacterium]|nr:hypothetical protein [Gemmatimonadales bacterium]
ESPYTQAFHGRASPAYQAMEDSLAIALGIGRARATGAGSATLAVEPPRTGPRGPDLEGVVLAHASQRAAPNKRPTPVRRPGDKTPVQPDDRP